MTSLLWLIPVALLLGSIGLVAFVWSLKSGQFEDLDGSAQRILYDDDGPDADGTSPVGGGEPPADPGAARREGPASR